MRPDTGTVSTAESDDDLEWLNDALFVDGGFTRESDGWLPLSRKTQLQRLIPIAPQTVAATFDNAHQGMSRMARVYRSLARQASGPLVSRAPRSRQIGLDAALGLDGDGERSLLAALRRYVPDASHVAITLGPVRSNRKPVVQLLDDQGRSIAFAKVAVDELTAELVTNEMQWLERIDDSGTGFRAPTISASFAWRGRPVVVISAVPASPRSVVAALQPNVAVAIAPLADAVAALAPAVRITVAEMSVVQDATAAPDPALRGAATRIVEHCGDNRVAVGPWHGDLSPWNLMVRDGETWVIDWEFASSEMPIGSDVAQHTFMRQTQLDAQPIPVALRAGAATFDQEIAGSLVWFLALASRDPGTTISAAACRAIAEHIDRDLV